MNPKKIAIYAAAAVGVGIAGIFLSKDMREVLFSALSNARTHEHDDENPLDDDDSSADSDE